MKNFLNKAKVFFGFGEEDGLKLKETPQPNKGGSLKSLRGSLIKLPTSSNVKYSEVIIVEPRVYEDSINIAAHLREGKPVIIKLKYLDNSQGKRLIDFVCGTAYAINGHMLKIGENIFLFTPESILIVDNEEKTALEQGLEAQEKTTFFSQSVTM